MPNNSSSNNNGYEDPYLMNSLIQKLKEKGEMNTLDINNEKNATQIKFKLADLYRDELLKSVLLQEKSNIKNNEVKLYRVFYTTKKFRNLHTGAVQSKYDDDDNKWIEGKI